MLRRWISLGLFSLGGCIVANDEQGTLTFDYLLLQEDINGNVGVVLCDNDAVSIPGGTNFFKVDVAKIIVTGVSERGLTVRREAECFFQPDDADVDNISELGTLQVQLPVETYTQLTIELENAQGIPVAWANDPDNGFQAVNDILLGNNIEVTADATTDIGDLLVQLGEDGAVDDELKIFIE